jgi:hypothetical protein
VYFTFPLPLSRKKQQQAKNKTKQNKNWPPLIIVAQKCPQTLLHEISIL